MTVFPFQHQMHSMVTVLNDYQESVYIDLLRLSMVIIAIFS